MNDKSDKCYYHPIKLSSSEWLSSLSRVGNGEMGRRVAELDWSKTPIGPVDLWPQSLRSLVKTLLSSQYPMVLTWGPEFTQFYNDGYSKFIGSKHPGALGDDIRNTLAESWDILGPMIDRVIKSSVANWTPALLLLLERSGYKEEAYFSVSHAPAENDFGEVAGMLAICSEVTQQVLSQRRFKLLNDLAAKAGEVRDPESTCMEITEAISAYPLDIPFALIYLFEGNTDKLGLKGKFGIDKGEGFAPLSIDLHSSSMKIWRLEQVVSGNTEVIEDVDKHISLPAGLWNDPVKKALAMPITSSGQAKPLGVLIVGISPNRALDEEYSSFYKLFAGQVSLSLSNSHAYQEERKRAQMLVEVDEAKTAFFSNISHEFRTPLTLLLGPLEEILSSSKEEELRIKREPLQAAYRNGIRLLKLVNTLLDFSRVEAGRIEASYEPTDLATFTTELASLFRSAIERAGLKLILKIPSLSEPIYVDREMWEKIVLNLLSNAFKFTLNGEIEVSLWENIKAVEFKVRDTGTGISEENLTKVFERFHRVQGAKSRSHEGSGIGLALTKELVKLHHGSISVKSSLDEGSVFTVTIPKGKTHLPSEKIRASRTLESKELAAKAFTEEISLWPLQEGETSQVPFMQEGRSPSQDGQPQILLVDDNADMRAYVERLLSSKYEVKTASNGRVALDRIKQKLPDLVLSDVMMPEMDGFELLKKLRADERTKAIPIILLSARAGQESTVVGIEAGADDYLVKPFSAKELLARVHQHLTMAKLRQEYESEHAIRERIEESEKRFRNLAEAMPQIVWTSKADGAVDYYNSRWFEYTGMSWKQTEEWGWKPALHPDDVMESFEQWAQAVKEGTLFVREHRLKRASDGTYRWHLLRAIPVFDDEGNIIRWFGTATDIQEQKQAIEMRDEFLSIASHELKTPITSLKLQLQLTDRKVKPEENMAPSPQKLSQTLKIAMEQTDRLNNLVEGLLDVSKIQVGKFEMTFNDVNAAIIIEGIIHHYQAQLDGARCPVELKLDTDLIGKWDKLRIEQVITNLLTNAIKYAPGKPIEISLKREAEMGVITVRDHGPGIPKEKRDMIFERFERAVSAKHTSGLGLGLFISKQIIQAHHGSIRVESKLGQGSAFIVKLPLDPEGLVVTNRLRR